MNNTPDHIVAFLICIILIIPSIMMAVDFKIIMFGIKRKYFKTPKRDRVINNLIEYSFPNLLKIPTGRSEYSSRPVFWYLEYLFIEKNIAEEIKLLAGLSELEMRFYLKKYFITKFTLKENVEIKLTGESILTMID